MLPNVLFAEQIVRVMPRADVLPFARRCLAVSWRPPVSCVNVVQVITDPITARSKGYGFVRFGSESERDRALSEMAGHIISNRPVRVSIATAKKSPALAAAGVSPASISGQVLLGDMDPTNTTLFIGGLNAAVR